jgi:SNF2 family DNA or RNA helicase
MDRVHRIGQKLSVRVLRFVMKGTIEERMVALQQMKEAIAKGCMEKLKPDEVRKARVADLKSLFDLGTESSDSKA